MTSTGTCHGTCDRLSLHGCSSLWMNVVWCHPNKMHHVHTVRSIKIIEFFSYRIGNWNLAFVECNKGGKSMIKMPMAVAPCNRIFLLLFSKFNFYTTNLRFISWADWIIFFFFHHYNEKCYLLKSVSALSRDCLFRLSLLILIDRLSDNVSNDRNQSKSFSVGYIISSRRKKPNQIKSDDGSENQVKTTQ